MTARQRRRIHLTLVVLWVGPGLATSWFLMHSVAWVVFMSWFANVYTCVSALSGETPKEQESQ